MAAPAVVELEGLARDFRKKRVVDGLRLSIACGELFGLVGPDGAGKTTTLRLLAGLLDVSDGKATILGFDLKSQSEAIKPHIGYMAQQFSLYGELSVLENLQFFADAFDVSRAECAARSAGLLSFAGLTDFKNRRAAHLSGGMQKKLALACTLIHQPRLLLLDEPTTGVDPVSRREFWQILNELHLQGTTIVVSTPYMDEADRCSRVGLMYAGKLVACDTPGALRRQLEGEVIELQPEDWRLAKDRLATLPGVREVQTCGESLHLLVDCGKLRLAEIERTLKRAGIAYRNLRIVPARMEQVFISMMHKMEE